jgi:hypothetical protein
MLHAVPCECVCERESSRLRVSSCALCCCCFCAVLRRAQLQLPLPVHSVPLLSLTRCFAQHQLHRHRIVAGLNESQRMSCFSVRHEREREREREARRRKRSMKQLIRALAARCVCPTPVCYGSAATCPPAACLRATAAPRSLVVLHAPRSC